MSVRREMRVLAAEGLVPAVEVLPRMADADTMRWVESDLIGVAAGCIGAEKSLSALSGVFEVLEESSVICGFNGVRKGDLNGLCSVRVALSRRRRFAAGVDMEGDVSAAEG